MSELDVRFVRQIAQGRCSFCDRKAIKWYKQEVEVVREPEANT